MQIDQIIIKPLITEKSTNAVKSNYYAFIVDKDANKFQIKNALEELYSVKVGEIKIVNRKGKKRRVGRIRQKKKLPDTKIAYVKLLKGSLEIFPKA